MSSVAHVVIVGRTNVGKSTLFNRLSSDVRSLTLDQEGVTRDVIKDAVSWRDYFFTLADTGGISLRKTNDVILEKTRQKALDMLDSADVLLFVCDGKAGVLPEDREISKHLHKLGKKVVLLINKIDVNLAKEQVYEFDRLGHGTSLTISAQHGIGINDLLDEVVYLLPKQIMAEETDTKCKVVLLGKPNVGKSSLMNLLLNEERSIVTNQPGTTREAITETIKFHKEDIELVDTAGVRRKRRVNETIETLMVKSTLRAVEDADVILLLLDASDARISDQELKLAFYAFEKQNKALILLFNKQDLVDDIIKEKLEFSLAEYEFLMKKIGSLSISCESGKNIGRILPLVDKIWKRHSQTFDSDELTMLFNHYLEKKPLFHKRTQLKLLNAKQIKSAPITIVLTVNYPEWFGPSQLGFFENLLRRNADLDGVPIKFLTRKKRSSK